MPNKESNGETSLKLKIAPEKVWFFKTASTFLLGQKVGLFSGTETLVSGMKQQRRVLRFKGYILCCMYAFISVGGHQTAVDATAPGISGSPGLL